MDLSFYDAKTSEMKLFVWVLLCPISQYIPIESQRKTTMSEQTNSVTTAAAAWDQKQIQQQQQKILLLHSNHGFLNETLKRWGSARK